MAFPQDEQRSGASRSGPSGKSGFQKRKGVPHKEVAETEWRKTAKGKALAAKVRGTYRASMKAVATTTRLIERKRVVAR